MQGTSTETIVEPDVQPEVNQPGLGELRDTVANHLRRSRPTVHHRTVMSR